MKILAVLLAVIAFVFLVLFFVTRYKAAEISAQFPAFGSVTEIGGREIHFLDVTEGDNADLPPLLFVHGASGNLRDQAVAFQKPLEGRARMIFVDRPGHGWSERGPEEANTPEGHGAVYAELLDDIGIESAVVVCHSMGCASAIAMALNHPEKVRGLVFLAPATHRWPGGVTWYYEVTALPVVGWLFSETLSLPAGLARLESGARSVFDPSEMPDDYVDATGIALVLRPEQFRNNARDVTTLKSEVTRMQPRYSQIKKPTVIITGNKDDVVLPDIHSVGLERDIEGAELIVLDGVGHKPDYAATRVAIEAIEKVSRR
ncbi:alpha/beta fold hydrolase [Pseudahrensia aquimaris]|uniref:Alpha/beta fold hydrolase n=1 Tax=Pseudahrensia aquimaris TaxID=744461 RepID=A0ABW3FF69_9HYPH